MAFTLDLDTCIDPGQILTANQINNNNLPSNLQSYLLSSAELYCKQKN